MTGIGHRPGFLCLTPGQATLWTHDRRGACRLASWTDAECEQAAAQCAGSAGLHLLIEDPADPLHVEQAPPVAPHHRRRWVHFRLERLFPDAPCRGLHRLPQRRVAFSAPARPAAPGRWLAALYRHGVTVHSVQSATLLTAALAARIAAGHDGVVLCLPAFADHSLRFLRLDPDRPLSRVICADTPGTLFDSECRHLADDLPRQPEPVLIVVTDAGFAPSAAPDWPFALHRLPASQLDNCAAPSAIGAVLHEAQRGHGLLSPPARGLRTMDATHLLEPSCPTT